MRSAGAFGAAALAASLGAGAGASASAASPSNRAHVHAVARASDVPILAATTTKSYAATVSSFKTAVSSAGMMVLGQINQAGALSITGLHLKGAQSFFVGNPTVGKKLFEMDPAVGAVIPLHMYVFVNAAGRSEISYLDPTKLAALVDPKLAVPAAMISQVATKIVHSVTGAAPKVVGQARSLRFVTMRSPRSFAATTSSLKTAVSSAGMMVLGQLNQAGALSIAGLHLKGAETYFVGNPTVGKKFFQMDPAVGIEIPVAMYLWVNPAGVTEVGYFSPAPVFSGVSPKLASSGPMFAQIAAKVAHGAA